MKIGMVLILALLVLAGFGPAYSEEEPGIDPAGAMANAPNTQWAWGEVTAVDVPGKAITMKYLDYETDQEKELLLAVDDSTSYENAASLEQIQPKDNLSVDYAYEEGRNIAKGISVEKTDDPEAVAGQAGPDPMQADQ
ncbi:MAG: hypothetical protein WC478_00690 [Candidatus Omnitrophota bacterium]